ncbi:MAG: potassium channel family protein [Anaerolineae bacterium]|nr:potassium channel family protein [Anaerolineae bacterium]NUQ03741.1 two pore domain potassium channel family protein [Anaerolineae bacterium]
MQRVQARVRYLFVGAALVTLIYPMSETGFVPAVIYLVLFCAFFGAGVAFVAVNRKWVWLGVIAAVWQTVLGVLYLVEAQTRTPDPVLTVLLFGGFIVFDAIIIYALLEFVFVEVRRMSNAVIYAAITVYILLGYAFAPAYMCIETITRATQDAPAFMIAYAPDTALYWQKFVYYSFVTLTTMGYGDILPVTSWAQAFAALEGAVGVLYIAILIGRLVGLNSGGSQKDES